MQHGLSIKTVGNATSLFLALSFVLCVGVSLLSSKHLMSGALQMWLPGFVWLTGPSFLLGLAESYAYGWFIALLWVPLFNVFTRQPEQGQRQEEEVAALGLKR